MNEERQWIIATTQIKKFTEISREEAFQFFLQKLIDVSYYLIGQNETHKLKRN